MNRRKRVYVAGPISLGDRQANFDQAIRASLELLKEGYAVYTPHAWMLIDATTIHTPDRYEMWLDQDFAWIEVCDGLLRLPGSSAGADREVTHAWTFGVPVFHSVEELCDNL